jgi:RNA polymerase sigma factor (sigma-70 family)
VEREYVEREGHGPPVDPPPGPEDRDAMWTALGTLTGRQRAAIVLRYYEDLTEAETAEVLGCRLGTVKSLVSRGLARLREEMGRDD